MRYAYALMITMLFSGLMLADVYAQGRGRGSSSEETVRRDSDEDARGRSARGRTAGNVDRRDRDAEDARARSSRSRTDDDREDDGWDEDDRDDDYDRSRRGRDGGLDDIIFGDDDYDDDDYYERRGKDKRKGNGPPFCRDGRGHPVHGWEWCEDKGYGDERYDPIWRDSRRNDDIIFRRDDRRGRSVSGGVLDDILGRRVYEGLVGHRRDRNLGGALSGYWLDDDYRTLQVRSGSIPLAEFRDHNGDGRVDAVRLNDRRY